MDLLWKPLLEATAQTIVGAIGTYGLSKALSVVKRRKRYIGAMDFWERGIRGGNLDVGDSLIFEGLISPYIQLFPNDPFLNGKRWNKLYNLETPLNSTTFQAMEFYHGSDATLRIGSLNGETLVGLYHQYGYIGEGIIGIVPTKLITKSFDNFFSPEFYGARVQVEGTVAKCPSQHGFVMKGIALKAGLTFDRNQYQNLLYIQIKKIIISSRLKNKYKSLLGSPWAVTSENSDQYIVQYGYLSNQEERKNCSKNIQGKSNWDMAEVYYDGIDCPSEDLNFKKKFIL